jgi:hypothetical protein
MLKPQGLVQRIHDPVMAAEKHRYHVFSTGSRIPFVSGWKYGNIPRRRLAFADGGGICVHGVAHGRVLCLPTLLRAWPYRRLSERISHGQTYPVRAPVVRKVLRLEART